jgi:hypothetical protein
MVRSMGQPHKQTLECEIRLRVTRDFTLPQLPGGRLPSRLFTSTYFDTEGYQLAREGEASERLGQAGKVWAKGLGIGGTNLC